MRLLFYLFLVTSLFAETTAITENDPSSLVEGVSVITGDLYVYEEDYVVQGTEPFSIRRAYLSSGASISEFAHLSCDFYLVGGYLCIKEPNGTAINYSADPQNSIQRPQIGNDFYGKNNQPLRYNTKPFVKKAKGLANTSSGKISAQTNLKNQYVVFDPKKDDKGKSFTLYASDGTERRYANVTHQGKDPIPYSTEKHYTVYSYKLLSESLPNGRVIHYLWDHDVLKTIWTAPKDNPKRVFAALNIPSYKKPSPKRTISGSDGRSLTYHNHPTSLKNVWVPNQISSPDLPDLTMGWDLPKGSKHHQIGHFTFPKGRKVQIQYDSQRRVKQLLSPVGKDDTLLATHAFQYNKKSTDVFDIKDNKTTYYWNDDFRLTQIDRSIGPKFHSGDLFVWEGHLLKSKTFLDETGTPIFSKVYKYDESGNIQEEALYGNLSGQGPPLRLGDQSLPLENGVEKAIQYTWYNEKNLPRRREDPSGLATEWTYLPGTHLLSSELLFDSHGIHQRHFYRYDTDFTLIEDDGTALAPDNLANVKTRTIKRITPKKEDPYLGLPETIEELYWDGQQEVLLKKTVLHYRHPGALVHQKDIYDAKRILRYSLTYDYDGKGRLKEETNPIGQIAKYGYDDVGNRDSIQDFGQNETRFKYDYSNRLTQKKEAKRILTYGYDLKHNLDSEIDEHGHETTHEYDPFGHLKKTTLPDQAIIQKDYDSAGNEILHIDALGHETHKSYNARGQPILVVYPDETQEEWVYYLDGSLKTHTDAKGVVTSYVRDVFGRVREKTVGSAKETFTYKGRNLISKTDAEGYKTVYDYDGAGRKISEECCGEKITYGYDELGRQNLVQEGDLLTLTEFDLLDRPITEIKKESDQILRWMSYGYDDAGNQNKIIRSVEGKKTEEILTYDSLKRLTQKKDSLGHIETFDYNDAFQNEDGQTVLQKTHTDPLGLQTIETFDILNRVAFVEKKKGKTLSSQAKTYDLNGSLKKQIDTVYSPDGSSRQVTTEWDYDVRGRIEKLIEANTKVTTYTYHPRGELFKITKPNGVVLTHQYNDLGYLTSLTSSDGTVDHQMDYDLRGYLTLTDGILRGVDHHGKLLTESHPNFSVENRYDTRGRRRFFLLPKADLTIEYEYDALDLKKVLWNGLSHTYTTHDLSGNLLEANLMGDLGRAVYHYDPLSRKTDLTAPSFSQSILEFDPVGNIRKMCIQDEEVSYTYDDLYQLTSETGLFAHTYAFDSLNNRLQKDEEAYQINDLNEIVSHLEYDLNGNPRRYGDMSFTYDALDRLIRIERPESVQTFSYDSLHRCLSTTVNGEKTYFLFDGQNEIGALDGNLQLKELRILGMAPHAEIGAAVALQLQGKIYIPIHDLQGNVAVLLPLVGQTPDASYRYSAFGEEQISGEVSNPWRFASKRTDSDLVNFGRRFYVPALGRWLNPDPEGFHDGMNLYAYVHNAPLTHFDEYGLFSCMNWAWQQQRSPQNGPSYADKIISSCMHELYEPVRAFIEPDRSFNGLSSFFPSWAGLDNGPLFKSGGKETLFQGHKFIDQFFGTDLAYQYEPDFMSRSFRSQVTKLEMPLPGSFASSVGRISQISKSSLMRPRALSISQKLGPRKIIPNQRFVDPFNVKFSQPTITQNLSNGRDINELIWGLRSGKINTWDIPTIRVVEYEGNLVTLDNRRLAAFQNAQMRRIPIQKMNLSNPEILREFRNKYNPIDSGRKIVVNPSSKWRKLSEQILREHGQIE